MTRSICTYIAQGYMVEKGKPNPALDAATRMSLDDVEMALLGSAPQKKTENGAGSYEKFMSMLGARGGSRPG
jgi:hypothetical protein